MIEGYSSATSGSTFGVNGAVNSTAGTGVYGKASATTGATVGVRGTSLSTTGTGVVGSDTATSGATTGVVGQVSSAAGVAGVFDNTAGGGAEILSGRNNGTEVFGVGTFGDVSSGAINTYSDSNTVISASTFEAVDLWLHAPSQSYGGPTAIIEGNGKPAIVATVNGNVESDGVNTVIMASGTSDSTNPGTCTMDTSGDLACTGTKSAAVSIASGQRVALYAMESPENWFEDFGSGKLVSGVGTVKLESVFMQTVNSALEYHVFLTPRGDCKGLYVAQETPSSFEIRELGGGQSNVGFDYRIVARRKGYENLRLADITKKMQMPNIPKSPASKRRTKTVASVR